MITVEEKLSIFKKIVFDSEEEKLKALLEAELEKNKIALEAKREEMQAIRTDILRKKRSQAQVERNEVLSKQIEEEKTKLLEKRKALKLDLEEAIIKKANEWVNTPAYKEYLCVMLNKQLKEFNEKEAIIYIRKEDDASVRGCLSEFDLNMKIDETRLSKEDIGGFIIRDKEQTYNLDNTIRTLIEENNYLIGSTLNTRLSEVGDHDE